MKFMYFSIKYRYSDISDILLKKHILHLNRFFCCNHTCYCVYMVSVTSASRYITSASCYHPLYQNRSSLYIRGLIPRNFAKLAKAVPIASDKVTNIHKGSLTVWYKVWALYAYFSDSQNAAFEPLVWCM